MPASRRCAARKACARARLRGHIEVVRAMIADIDAATAMMSRMASTTAIQPIVVGANEAALGLADALLEQGFWVPAVRPPTVPPGTARLRLSLLGGARA